eukprot:466836_1
MSQSHADVRNLNDNFLNEITQELIQANHSQQDIINGINDVKLRLEWNIGSFCSVFARTEQIWCHGEIYKIDEDTETNEEWLSVKYKFKHKDVQRFCHSIKPLDLDANYDNKIILYIAKKLKEKRINPEKIKDELKQTDVVNKIRTLYKVKTLERANEKLKTEQKQLDSLMDNTYNLNTNIQKLNTELRYQNGNLQKQLNEVLNQITLQNKMMQQLISKPTINNVEFIKNEDIKKLLHQIIDNEMKNIPQIAKKQCADLSQVTDTNIKTLPQFNCDDIVTNAIAISFGSNTREEIKRLAFEQLKESIGTKLDEKAYNQYKQNQYKQCINQLVNKKFDMILEQMK